MTSPTAVDLARFTVEYLVALDSARASRTALAWARARSRERRLRRAAESLITPAQRRLFARDPQTTLF